MWLLPVGLSSFEWRSLKSHWTEVVVLAVVDVGHRLVIQPLAQFHQRSFSWKHFTGYLSIVSSLHAGELAGGGTHLSLLPSCVSRVVCTECTSSLALWSYHWFVWTTCKMKHTGYCSAFPLMKWLNIKSCYVPHQSRVASERTELDFLKRRLKAQNGQSLLLRDGREASNTNTVNTPR